MVDTKHNAQGNEMCMLCDFSNIGNSLDSAVRLQVWQKSLNHVLGTRHFTLTVPFSVKMSINKNQTPLNELAFHTGVEDIFVVTYWYRNRKHERWCYAGLTYLWLENCGINFIHCLLGKLLARGLPLTQPHHLDDLF